MILTFLPFWNTYGYCFFALHRCVCNSYTVSTTSRQVHTGVLLGTNERHISLFLLTAIVFLHHSSVHKHVVVLDACSVRVEPFIYLRCTPSIFPHQYRGHRGISGKRDPYCLYSVWLVVLLRAATSTMELSDGRTRGSGTGGDGEMLI